MTELQDIALETGIKDRIQSWLTGQYDEQTKNQIKTLLARQQFEALTDAFYKDLEFGTGGLRGEMGVGSNRINKYTVGKATQGLANYLKACFPNEKVIKAAIAYDSRNNSPEFAKVAASVLSANGIQVYVFEELRPTPELSFAIRYLECHTGIVLTASHNPKEYNGYKAYWQDGCQVTPPHDKNIITEVNKIQSISDVKFDAAEGLITYIGSKVDEAYLERATQLSVDPDLVKRQKDLKIVFSPIHGTGITLVPRLLARFGFENVHVVEKQATPDGNFPTVVYPNPEEKEAMTLALKKAEDLDADLVMATDPDADRVGIATKNENGDFVLLNGNQTATLLYYYMLNAWQQAKRLTGKQFVVKTIVTTDILEKIAEKYKVKHYSVLTGFKYIGALIKELEGKEEYIVGGEESYGYLAGDFVRDKDAISSCALIAEMTAFAKDNKRSLLDMLADIYTEFGFYQERLLSITRKGKAGAEEIADMMTNLRNNPPQSIDGSKVLYAYDYKSSSYKELSTGEVHSLDLPSSNVLQFVAEDGTKVTARPSGTEPKIKFYFSVNAPLESADKYKEVEKQLNAKIDRIIEEMSLN